MTTGTFGTKQSSEEFYYQFDFGGDIAAGRTIAIASVVITAIDSNGANVTATVIDATLQNIDGHLVNFWFQAGTDGEKYTITCELDDDLGQHYEKDGYLWVQDYPEAATVPSAIVTWGGKQDSAKRMIDKYGAVMSIILETHNTYNATADSYSAAEFEYPIRAVLTNPTMVNDKGEYSKSDRTRLLIAAKGLPALDDVDFRIEYGLKVWHPDKIVAINPGGTTIIYIVDMK